MAVLVVLVLLVLGIGYGVLSAFDLLPGNVLTQSCHSGRPVVSAAGWLPPGADPAPAVGAARPLVMPGVDGEHPVAVHDVAFAPDDGTVIVGGEYGLARTWHVPGAELGCTLSGKETHTDGEYGTQPVQIRAVAVAPGGTLAAVDAGWDPGVRLWDLRSGRSLGYLPGNPVAQSLQFATDGRFLAVSTDDDHVTVYEIPSRRQLYRIPGSRFAFTPDGARLAVVDPDRRSVRILAVDDAHVTGTISLPRPGFGTGPTVEPGQSLPPTPATLRPRPPITTPGPTGSPDPTASPGPTATPGPTGSPGPTASPVLTLTPGPTPTGSDGSGGPPEVGTEVWALGFDATGSRLTVISDTIQVWDVATNGLITARPIPGAGQASDISIGADATLLAFTRTSDQTATTAVTVLDLTTRAIRVTIGGTRAVIAPHRRTVAVVTNDDGAWLMSVR
jgi:WD40 repeat protein